MNAPLSGIIDAHHHLCDPQVMDYPWLRSLPDLDRVFDSSDLSAAVEGLGVAGTIVVQASADAGETDCLLALAERSELILGVVGWVDLEHPAVAERLAALSAAPLVGIRHQAQDESDPAWLMQPYVARGLRALRDAGLPFDLLVREPQRAAALELPGTTPDQAFVIDHLAKPDIAAGEWDGWHAWMAAMAEHPQVVCKVSGLVTEASWTSWRQQNLERYIDAALELFGTERCMFGSDWPVSLLAADYAEVLGLVDSATAGLSASERHSVFQATAASVYGVTVKGG